MRVVYDDQVVMMSTKGFGPQYHTYDAPWFHGQGMKQTVFPGGITMRYGSHVGGRHTKVMMPYFLIFSSRRLER